MHLKALPVQPVQQMASLHHLCGLVPLCSIFFYWLAGCLLEALDLVLTCCGSLGAAQLAPESLSHLDEPSAVLLRFARSALLKPMLLESSTQALRTAWLSAGDLTAPAPRALQPPLTAEALRLALQLLVRCTPNGPEATALELLELAHGAPKRGLGGRFS